jgi:hypothetical protein
MKALQRPTSNKRPTSDKRTTARPNTKTMPPLALDICHAESRAHAQYQVQAANLAAKLVLLEGAIASAHAAQMAFFQENGYEHHTREGYGDTEYYAVHPLYLQPFRDGLSVGSTCYLGEVPEWGIVRVD